ncbi:hypothetical protein LTR27_000124 [Elasticomyces elasticus]|nr:hypothetical protein LTR27_000124 [Elasticomyces elasticus]
MTKRKASTSLQAPAPTKKTKMTAKPVLSAEDQAAHDAKIKEHREYLLAGVGATIEDKMLPAVTRKRKIVAKKSAAKEEVVDEEGAKTPDGQTPRNAATSTKPKASTRKRKASTLPTPKPSDSPEGVVSNPTEQGSDVTPPKAEKAKPTPRKRKAEARATPDEIRENVPPKKRIRAGTTISSSSDKTGSPGKGVPPRPAPAPLTPILAAKVRQVHRYLADANGNVSSLVRDPITSTHISVPELELNAALMRLRADYGLGDSNEAHIADVECCILNQYLAPVLQMPSQSWIILDSSLRSDFLRQVQDKIVGHELHDVNLLEIELEIQSQQARASLAQHEPTIKMLSSPEDMQAFFDKTLADVLHNEKQRALETEREQANAALQAAAGLQEMRHMGVCPQPPIPVI